MELALQPGPGELDIPGVYQTAMTLAQDLAPEVAQEGERQQTLKAAYLRQRGEEGLARKHAIMAVVLARRVAEQLPPLSKGGRPSKEAGEETRTLGCEFSKKSLQNYRAMLVLDDNEFRHYVTTEAQPTKSGAAKLGEKKRKGPPDQVPLHQQLFDDFKALIRKCRRLKDHPSMPAELAHLPDALADTLLQPAEYCQELSRRFVKEGWVA